MDLFTIDDIKPQILFQTHEYKQRIGNPLHGGNITFFKKEVIGYLGITPFIQSYNYLYPILQSRFHLLKGRILPPNINLYMINKKGDNINHLMNFLKNYHHHMISVDFSTILNWIKTNYWFVFILVHEEQILAIYFFRDTHLQYEDYCTIDMNTKCVELVNSYNNIQQGSNIRDVGDNNQLFYMGFIEAIRELSTKINLDFRLIQIPDISKGNSIILEKWNNKNTAIMKTFLAYYFFNYCWKIDKNNVFIII
jgi:hypothetical protein